ncbi:MAG TPA: response regulator [Vicinamibacteria bacterium]|nr:response regulator [Vicinamibacteria bacterium]
MPIAGPAAAAARVLLVDDEPANLDLLRQALDGRGYRLLVATSGEDALKVARRAHPSLVLLDVMMPGIDGFETCRRLKADPQTAGAAVIFLSALAEAREKVRGLQAGAVDFVSKPFQPEEVVARVHTHLTVQQLQQQLESRNDELARELQVAQQLLAEARQRVEGALLGASPAVRALRETVAQRAASVAPLLLTGPAGAGQEAVARAVHHQSPRGSRAFIHVNCALLAPGQVQGALGPLELAEGGTLYLEEVHLLPPELQVRLAELLERAAAARAAGGVPGPDVRVIASTSAVASVESGLRPRLLAALETGTLRVPPLAERAEDVVELARFFLDRHARRAGAVVERLSEESERRLRAYRWPGNLRELESVIERSVLSAREGVLEVDAALLDEGLPLGHYRLVSKLGEGGMGEVWRARHQLLARPCAVKLIRPDKLGLRNRETALERFRREARTIARLSSPHTVRLYDYGVSESGSLYFVMELLRGLDLFALVKRFGPLPAGRVVHVLRQACRSLAEAHEAGLLHRDVKPHNLFLCRLGLECDVVKVLDFGLAKSTAGEEDAQITAEGTLTGTPAYMPPERAAGGPGDARSDIYALGCVAFWMLAGRTVFTGEPMAMVLDHVRTAPQRPSAVSSQPVPEPLERLVMGCLEKSPSRRPAGARDLGRRLGEVALEEPWTAERAEAWWRDNLPELVSPEAGEASLEIALEPAD